MKKITLKPVLFLCAFSMVSPLQATSTDQNSGSIGASISVINPSKYVDVDRSVISATVKVYHDGEVELENIQFSEYRIRNRLEKLGIDLETDYLGFYREELHRDVGSEMGFRLVDGRATKVVNLDENEDFKLELEAQGTLDKISRVKANDNNAFIQARIIDDDSEAYKFRDDYGLNFKIRAELQYNYDEMKFSAGVYGKQNRERDLKGSIGGDRYSYSRQEKGIYFTFTPSKKGCHRITSGLKQVKLNQTLNGEAATIKDNEFYVSYECRLNMDGVLFGSKKSSSEYIRY